MVLVLARALFVHPRNPFDKRTSTRTRVYNFMAAFRWLLSPMATELPQLGRGADHQRPLLSAHTFSALEAKARWSHEEYQPLGKVPLEASAP